MSTRRSFVSMIVALGLAVSLTLGGCGEGGGAYNPDNVVQYADSLEEVQQVLSGINSTQNAQAEYDHLEELVNRLNRSQRAMEEGGRPRDDQQMLHYEEHSQRAQQAMASIQEEFSRLQNVNAADTLAPLFADLPFGPE